MYQQVSILQTLSREPIQMLRAEALCYGAKDTGEMGGGAAAAILSAAGAGMLPALRSELSRSSRQLGDVVVTDALGLQDRGVRWVLHLISIIKHTPQGAWCPEPQKLRHGVKSALLLASKLQARSIAFSALGTGEGRVAPELAARLMLDGVRDFRLAEPRSALAVTFSLPSYRDYEAFLAASGR